MNILLKKAIAALAATTILLAPMQALAQSNNVEFCNNSGKNCATIPVGSSGEKIDPSTLPDYVKFQLKNIESGEILQAQYFEIEGEKILFAQVNDAQKATKAYFPKGSPFKGKFLNKNAAASGNDATERIEKLIANGDIDLSKAIAPEWVNTQNYKNADIIHIHELLVGNKIAYTIKTSDYGWYVVLEESDSTAPNPNPAPTTPISNPTPVIKSLAFYTSNDKEFLVPMKDGSDTEVDVEKAKEAIKKLLDNNLVEGDENIALAKEFIDYAYAKAEIHDIPEDHNGEKIQKKLFIKTNDHTTKVFHTDKSTSLQNHFKHSTATKGMPDDVDFDNTKGPSWITDHKNITYYHATPKGYTLLTEAGHWYYATKKEKQEEKVETTPFYTSNKNPFPVVLKDEKTVDFNATKKILETMMDKVTNPDDKKAAEEFVKNGVEKNVEIRVIEDETLLFVQSDDKSTKVFHKNKDSHLLQNFGVNKDKVTRIIDKDGKKIDGTSLPNDIDFTKTEKPDWILVSELNADNVIAYGPTKNGYTLLTKSGHWYYANKKITTPSTSTGGSSGGSGGGYAYSSPVIVSVPAKPTTEVKGDEILRPNTAIFANFTKKCEQNVKNLSDPRLVDYYDVLKVENKSNLDRALTRAEFLKLVLNSANINVSTESDPSYSDVPATHTLKHYIAYATRMNMISGQDGKFRPDDIITRAEAAKIFVNAAALGLSTEINTSADVDANNSLAAYIQTAYDNCLLHGRKTLDGNPVVQPRIYEPNSAITLAETAKVLYNIVH